MFVYILAFLLFIWRNFWELLRFVFILTVFNGALSQNRYKIKRTVLFWGNEISTRNRKFYELKLIEFIDYAEMSKLTKKHNYVDFWRNFRDFRAAFTASKAFEANQQRWHSTVWLHITTSLRWLCPTGMDRIPYQTWISDGYLGNYGVLNADCPTWTILSAPSLFRILPSNFPWIDDTQWSHLPDCGH